MNSLMKIGKGLLISIGVFLIVTFIMTLFNYINLIKHNIVNIIEIVIIFVSLFIGSFYVGKKSFKRGWLEGIKFGLIFLIVLVLFNYLEFNNKFEVKNLLYYLILLSSSIFGSMFGINLKKNTSS